MSNRQITSREFKVMLKTNIFSNLQKGIFQTIEIIESKIGVDINSKNAIKEKKSKLVILNSAIVR